MRSMISACLFALLAMTFAAGPAVAEKVRCSAIRDSAMCLSEPTCWFDVNGQGCSEGPRPAEDACAAHESDSICSTSSLGCRWNPADKKCVSKAN